MTVACQFRYSFRYISGTFLPNFPVGSGALRTCTEVPRCLGTRQRQNKTDCLNIALTTAMTTAAPTRLLQLARALQTVSLAGAGALLVLVSMALLLPGPLAWLPDTMRITTPATALGLLICSGSLTVAGTERRQSQVHWLLAALAMLLFVEIMTHVTRSVQADPTAVSTGWATPMSLSTAAGVALVGLCVACKRWLPYRFEHELCAALLVSMCVYLTLGYWSHDPDIVDESTVLRTGTWTLAMLWTMGLAVSLDLLAAPKTTAAGSRRVTQRLQQLLRVIAGE